MAGCDVMCVGAQVEHEIQQITGDDFFEDADEGDEQQQPAAQKSHHRALLWLVIVHATHAPRLVPHKRRRHPRIRDHQPSVDCAHLGKERAPTVEWEVRRGIHERAEVADATGHARDLRAAHGCEDAVQRGQLLSGRRFANTEGIESLPGGAKKGGVGEGLGVGNDGERHRVRQQLRRHGPVRRQAQLLKGDKERGRPGWIV